ncbi:MAG: hypothetical protein JWP78_3910 [Mucilaginibacter sp.]|nr:hypothetical protein [Mucilaginibacter sp.]
MPDILPSIFLKTSFYINYFTFFPSVTSFRISDAAALVFALRRTGGFLQHCCSAVKSFPVFFSEANQIQSSGFEQI